MPFESATRNKIVKLPTITKPTGGGLMQIELPKTGFLARLWLAISITTAGTITTQNALGAASAIKRVRLTTNSGIDLLNISGAGYHYLLQNAQELMINGRMPKNQGNSTLVTATSYNLDMVLPVMINLHDAVGLVLLQNEQLQVLLSVEFEADSNVILTGGGTYTGTVTPYLEFFTVPPAKENYPALNVVHQILEDQLPVSATGDYIYRAPRGNTYLQLLFGYGINASPADNWSRFILRINQSDIIYDYAPNIMDMLVGYKNNLTRGLGQIPLDLLGSDGLGSYGSARDFINSALLTDLEVVLTATATGTLFAVRRMLMPLAGG
jgi:hypothetical protein